MLFRLVRSVKRAGTINLQFEQRIPSDVLPRVAGLKLSVPLGDGEFRHLTVAPKARAIRFSLGTFDPSIAKSRQGRAVAHLEDVWRSLRQSAPISLTNRQAVALSRDLYAAWVSGEGKERTLAILYTPNGWVRDAVLPDEEAAIFETFAKSFEAAREGERFAELEAKLGPIIDRLLLARGIREVDVVSRPLLLLAFASAIRDALKTRQRNAQGDYRPDPNSERFPEWRPPDEISAPLASPATATVSLKGLVDEWWVEAERTGIKRVTYVNYRNVVLKFAAFLEHDDATRVTPDDVLRYKDHRLASIYPKSGKLISPKTVKDTDLAALKTVLGWALSNRKLKINAASGLTVKLRKQVRLRGKSQTEKEAAALLRGALAYQPGGLESAFTTAAKRWVPWLCAYTGSRVGEMAQLRKQDIRQEGGHWVARITPDAGTVKNNEPRDVVLHAHLGELGFPAFVAAAPKGHLFLAPGGDVSMQLTGIRNRLAQFAREHVTDRGVAPFHGLRHRFKEVGIEVGIEGRILDAIQGQAPRTVAESYGALTVKAQAAAVAKFPRIDIEQTPEPPAETALAAKQKRPRAPQRVGTGSVSSGKGRGVT